MTRTVLITGCSSGFGRLSVQTFLRAEWNVVASMRAPEKAPERPCSRRPDGPVRQTM